MNTKTMAGLMILAGLNAAAADGEDIKKRVAVCSAVPVQGAWATVQWAREIAGKAFSGIGVHVEWHSLEKCPDRAIRIVWSTETLANDHPGALAYAMPFESTRIVVLWDRVKTLASRRLLPHLLGYVFAHEIAHILQGTGQHAREGILKARWTSLDYSDMLIGSLKFTAWDVDLIRLGLEWRSTTLRAEPAIAGITH